MADESFGYAAFKTGAAQVAFSLAPGQEELIGRHAGIGFITEDINLKYEQLCAAGVKFESPPEKQPWGGVLALFKDPDGNIFYLDQTSEDHP